MSKVNSYLRHVFCLPVLQTDLCSEPDGDIDAIGVCALSRYKRSLTRSDACLKNITASSCVIGQSGTSLTY